MFFLNAGEIIYVRNKESVKLIGLVTVEILFQKSKFFRIFRAKIRNRQVIWRAGYFLLKSTNILKIAYRGSYSRNSV